MHPNSEKASKSEPQLPSDLSGLDQAAEAGFPSIPQQRRTLNSHYVTRQQPDDALGLPDEDVGKRMDGELKDPSPPPCVFGPGLALFAPGCCLYPVKDCTSGQHLIYVVPDSVLEPTVAPHAPPSSLSNVSCSLQKLTSDPDIYTVPLDGCGVNRHVFGETVVHLLEVHGIQSSENAPVRLMVECSSSPGSPGEVKLHVMNPPPPPAPPLPPVQSPPSTVTVQLSIATDESFSSFHPEAHLPLSLIRGSSVYLQLNLQDPPAPDLQLLVHSCLAFTHTPYSSWMLVYDGCPGRGDSQRLPSSRSDPSHTQRILIPAFQSLPSESPSSMDEGGASRLQDPEIYFMCLTEVCYAADVDCTVSCIHSPGSAV
ncbi:hypothetical protein PBY51_008267 [Eleginops maclovinus]|uniref:ZP domain-containing protein n=2 Tax=Eleginops maclovinus TaxID=56733 RepID=A0AAN7X9T9_ELEMC|nr:hypothetical protein PBY51_008267 [Eleginops maclovinus]